MGLVAVGVFRSAGTTAAVMGYAVSGPLTPNGTATVFARSDGAAALFVSAGAKVPASRRLAAVSIRKD